MHPEMEDLTISEMAAEIMRIVGDRIRAAGGDRVTISLAELQIIYHHSHAIQRDLERDAQQKSSP